MKTETQKGQKLIQNLINKAQTNSEFKEQLISNPKEIMQMEIGDKFRLSEDKKIIVEDQSNASLIFLNIPKKLKFFDNLNLTDEELELVAGGEIWVAFSVGAAASAAVYAVCEGANGAYNAVKDIAMK